MRKKKTCLSCSHPVSKNARRCKSCAQKLVALNKSNEPENRKRIKEAIKAYKKGEKKKTINKRFRISDCKLYSELHRKNIKLRGFHTYKFDLGILKKERSEKYYLLGLLATDGYIGKNRGSKYSAISLNEKDKQILEDINRLFKYNRPLTRDRSSNTLGIVFYSDELYDYLNSYGITERKSLSLKLRKKIPPEFVKDFLRGCLDGDGTITLNRRKISVTPCMSASRAFIEQIHAMYLSLGYNLKLYNYSLKRKNTIYTLIVRSTEAIHLLDDLYSSNSICIQRKYEKFINLVRLTPDEMMMETSYLISSRSTCHLRQVGCITTNIERTEISSIGYNGQVKNSRNCCESSIRGECGCLHAEINALIKGHGSIMYCTFMPCKTCATAIINAGIEELYYGETDCSKHKYWKASKTMRDAGIRVKKMYRSIYDWKRSFSRYKLKEV
jgi:deoxycytidylate deaminase